MSRPTTRNKNKRHKPDDDNGVTSEILRRIHSTGQVTEDDIHQLYMIRKPVCQGCRINTKENPNCFCGLIPPPNGSRKSGLWQKTSDIVLALGPDPCKDMRESTDSPAGLTNLGATCYANSILQCLYMNTSFRAGVFSVEPDQLCQHPVLDQLARLFVQLHSSKRAFIDSAPFIRTLELDNGVQQDSHEFLTLLLSLLERSLSHSKVLKARTVVQDLFRGSVSHATRCAKCGQESEASSKMEDFYELELNIKGLKNLHESLDDYLSVEELTGDNQYFCESCNLRVDATRYIKLRTLPNFLNFQLKRCVFLPKTTTKKKLTSAFSFPGELNMRHRLCEPSESEVIYDLSAVLIHKGTAVNSGHYVAHIKDERTGLWWEFDDESVTKLGVHPFGEGSSTQTDKPLKLVSSENPLTFEQVDSVSNGNHFSNDKLISSVPLQICHEETFSSCDAYMLMYSRRNAKKYIEKPCTDYSDMLPFHLLEEVKEANAALSEVCDDYDREKGSVLHNINERRQEVRLVLSEAPVPSHDGPFFWIATEWLRQWADSVTSHPLDNTSIQCSHGKVPVSKVGSIKRLSARAWSTLHSKHGGGPTLNDSDFCIECLMDGAKTIVRADDYRYRRAAMRQIAEDAHAGKFLDGTLYYVSKAWLSHWLRRRVVDFPCEADLGPTASIRCPHGELLPEKAARAKRVLVPESLWLFLLESANTVKPEDPEGASSFPSDAETCAICSVEQSNLACLEDDRREAKLKQRQSHEKLFQDKSFALSPGCKYYLLPSAWLTKWRSYSTVGKNISSSEEPDGLDGVIDSLKCDKHSRLLERPPDLFWKRGAIYQKTSSADGLTIVTECDWKLFCDDWDGTDWDGITAEIEIRSGSGAQKVIRPSEEMVKSDTHMSSSNYEFTDDLEPGEPIVKTFPEVCEDCVGERESHKLMEKLKYRDEDICVYCVRGKEAPKFVLEASGAISDPDRRVSKRSKKTSFGNCINLKVSCSTTIGQLKMMIWGSLGVDIQNQILHKGPEVIEGENDTLADRNIFPGDLLWVKDTELHENRDIADELSDHKMEVQAAEEGFRGTLLTSSISTQVL